MMQSTVQLFAGYLVGFGVGWRDRAQHNRNPSRKLIFTKDGEKKSTLFRNVRESVDDS